MPAPRTAATFKDQTQVISWIKNERPGAEIRMVERSTTREWWNGETRPIWRFVYQTNEVIGHVAFVKEDDVLDPGLPRRFCQRGFQYERKVK